jgi:hypothetical protein
LPGIPSSGDNIRRKRASPRPGARWPQRRVTSKFRSIFLGGKAANLAHAKADPARPGRDGSTTKPEPARHPRESGNRRTVFMRAPIIREGKSSGLWCTEMRRSRRAGHHFGLGLTGLNAPICARSCTIRTPRSRRRSLFGSPSQMRASSLDRVEAVQRRPKRSHPSLDFHPLGRRNRIFFGLDERSAQQIIRKCNKAWSPSQPSYPAPVPESSRS